MLSNLQPGIKRPLTGIHQYSNHTKVKQFQIFTSQSQKNIKSNLTPGKKIETKSRPNTGGTKSPFKQNIRPLSYKDKFSLSSKYHSTLKLVKENQLTKSKMILIYR
jgi:hypothetical protein